MNKEAIKVQILASVRMYADAYHNQLKAKSQLDFDIYRKKRDNYQHEIEQLLDQILS